MALFMKSIVPGPMPLSDETKENASFYFGGAVINEWNPDPCVPTQIPLQHCESATIHQIVVVLLAHS